MKRIKSLIPFVFIAILVVSCGTKQNASPCTTILEQSLYKEVNKDLRINAPSDINTLKFGDFIYLIVDNISVAPIEIAPGKDLRIFWRRGNSWIEAKNLVDYLSAVDRISVKSSVDPGGTIYDLIFNIPEKQNTIDTCIILTGVKDPDGNRSNVLSYIELVLKR